jgi:tetraacyldisaccharide 4'-kinase
MFTPKFWKKLNLIAIALIPFSFVYVIGFFIIRLLTKSKQVNAKVICIGNLTAGGQGKTPSAIAIGKILDQLAINYAYISRGYGAKIKQSMIEIDNNCSAQEVGDEPLLLFNQAPTFVGKNRLLIAKKISKTKKFQALVLDDGLQNNQLKKDLKIIVVDHKIMFGNNLIIPAGPLRQPLKYGISQSDLIILIGNNSSQIPNCLVNKKIINAKILPTNLQQFRAKKIIAFCGIAYPEKFFDTLNNHQLEVIKTIAFKDHHSYNQKDFEFLQNQLNLQQQNNKNNQEIILLTTKKDWVKFPDKIKSQISYLDIILKFDDEELIKNEIRKLF